MEDNTALEIPEHVLNFGPVAYIRVRCPEREPGIVVDQVAVQSINGLHTFGIVHCAIRSPGFFHGSFIVISIPVTLDKLTLSINDVGRHRAYPT